MLIFGLGKSPKQKTVKTRSSKLFDHEIKFCGQCIDRGDSVALIGEQGSGKSSILEIVSKEKNAVYINYSGLSQKQFLVKVCEGFNKSTTVEKYNKNGDAVGEKALSTDELKDQILDGGFGKRALILDDAHHIPKSVLLLLDNLQRSGNTIILGVLPGTEDRGGLYNRINKIEIKPLTDLQIRDLMYRRSIELNLNLTPSELSLLQRNSGKNPMLAKKAVDQVASGDFDWQAPEHRDYVDISPFVVSLLSGLAIIRFIGLGLGDKVLYIIGGVAFILAIILKQLLTQLNRPRRYLR